MKIAVTGASGFVGRHVLAALALREDVEVVAASRSPVAAGDLPAGVRHVVVDVAERNDDAFDDLGRPDVLIHLAWDQLPHYARLHHFEVQLPEQYRFLAGLLHAGLSKLVCTGTCFEYGMRHGPLTEDMAPEPANPYAFAKDALRRQIGFLGEGLPFEWTWARLFYVYGGDQRPSTLHGQLAAALARGERSFRMSAGDQLRDYLHIDDVAGILVRLALDAPGAGPVNVCSGRPVSVRALVEQWIAESGQPMTIEFGHYPYSVHEPLAFWGSRARLQALLDRPGVSTVR